MPDYIEREAVINDIGELFTICYETIPNECGHHYIVENELKTHLDFVKSLPAANVREVVPGKWKQIEEVNDGGPLSAWLLSRYHTYACSICGYKFLNLHEDDRMYNFCPNCGAEMRT